MDAFKSALLKMFEHNIDMTKDSSMHFGDCPKAKKSKSGHDTQVVTFTSNWAYLPSVVLQEIFDKLDLEDRKNASSVCKNWRQNAYHPKWWQKVTFDIQPFELDKSKYLTSAFGDMAVHATIKVNTLSVDCVDEFITLIKVLSENSQLKSLMLEPTHCRFEVPTKQGHSGSNETVTAGITKSIKTCLPSLHKFSIGCIEDLSHFINDFVNELISQNPTNVTDLGLASLKDDPDGYQVAPLDHTLFTNFTNLKILSIDYDNLSDNFLRSLDHSTSLERLVCHLHGVRKGHPGTSNYGWQCFNAVHPNCEFRLTVIHAFNEIDELHEKVLRVKMPLTHLKVFFCENVNVHMLEYMSSYYSNTIKSVMWVDSINSNENKWVFAKQAYNESPDPFILMSWLCKYLEEIVLYGYKYWEENLIAIARLRGELLQKLEISEEDILHPAPDMIPNESAIEDIPLSMKKPWLPKSKEELHPVLCSPLAGDSDEYILPIVLADLH